MKNKRNWKKTFIKLHKVPALSMILFVVLFSISGIIMNHRSLFSSIDISRDYLGSKYQYSNWNKAAIKSSIKLSGDSLLIYGNIGVSLSLDNFKTFHDFNNGFGKGADRRKVESMIRSSKGDVYAGTLFGLYKLDDKDKWQHISLPIEEERIVDIIEANGDLLVMTRSHIMKADISGFTVLSIPQAETYDGKISLFKTLWQIHSGEILGLPGKLFVDLLAIVLLVMCFTGLVYFLFPKWIKRRRKKKLDVKSEVKFLKQNSKWHNKFGKYTVFFLLVLTLTGMFLRPPLLIIIASNKVPKIPFTHLDNDNSWLDAFRRMQYDKDLDRYLIATTDGVYYSDDKFSSELKKYRNSPPISVMGVNVFECMGNGSYLVGSFSGLFAWNPESNAIINYVTRKYYVPTKRMGPPISNHPVTGYIRDLNNKEYCFEYDYGVRSLSGREEFTAMPEKLINTPMSLWNLSLEVHTARIYQYIFGVFYMLIIPIVGIIIMMILISGYLIQRKR